MLLIFSKAGARPVFNFKSVKTNWRWSAISSELRVNEEIRARETRVISAAGEQLGIMTVRDALKMAQEKGLDLVEVAPTAKPIVCRIMDYGKFRYEQQKKEREAKKKQKIINLKEVRMTPKIEIHDFQVKAKAAHKFLSDGDKVKATIRFRGREIVHAELGQKLLQELLEFVKDVGALEKAARVEGKNMTMILTPKNN